MMFIKRTLIEANIIQTRKLVNFSSTLELSKLYKIVPITQVQIIYMN